MATSRAPIIWRIENGVFFLDLYELYLYTNDNIYIVINEKIQITQIGDCI